MPAVEECKLQLMTVEWKPWFGQDFYTFSNSVFVEKELFLSYAVFEICDGTLNGNV